MRKIKFKARNPETHEMEYWEPFKYNDNSFVEKGSWCEGRIVQFTGLYDKSGREIYNGDIIDCHVVVWVDRLAAFLGCTIDQYKAGMDGSDGCDLDDLSDGEIYGNIYDNPELLE